jgi:small subunit ribosomal protein S20
MPITDSAKKALRGSARKRVFNARRKDTLQSAMKKMKKSVAAGDKKEAQKFMSQVQKALDKAAKTGLIKKNAAARKKSRIAAMIKKIA